MTTTTTTVTLIGGVDTHKLTHYAAAMDDHGRLLGHHEFPADDSGYQRSWLGFANTAPCTRSVSKAPAPSVRR